jgi:hypothetical protein
LFLWVEDYGFLLLVLSLGRKNSEEDKKKTQSMATPHGDKRWKKYQEYAKLRNQVKNSVKKVKISMERDIVSLG